MLSKFARPLAICSALLPFPVLSSLLVGECSDSRRLSAFSSPFFPGFCFYSGLVSSLASFLPIFLSLARQESPFYSVTTPAPAVSHCKAAHAP